MRDNQKTKAELLQEVKTLRHHVAKLTKKDSALRLSDQKWYSLLKNTPDIVMIVDREGTIHFINHTVPGITIQETIGKKVYDYISPEHHDIMRKYIKRVFQAGHSTSQEIIGVGPLRNLSWYQAELGPIRQDGRIVAASIVTRDITERKKAEKKLIQSKAVTDGISEALILFDMDGTVSFVNPEYERVTGYKSSEIIGKNGVEVAGKTVRHDELEKVLGVFGRALKGENLKSLSTVLVNKNGKETPIEFVTSFVKDEKGKSTQIIAAISNITNRKRAEEALRESRHQFRSLVEVTSDWVWEVDKNGIYTYASPKVKELLGYEPEEIIGKTPFDLMPPDEAEHVGAIFRDITISRKPFERLENKNLHKDGRLIILETSGVPILDEGGNLLGYRGIDRDITERKKTEEEIKKFKEMADRATFGCGMADLNGNITYINDSFAKMHGYAPSELIGKNLRIFHTDAQIKRVSRLNKRLVETGERIRGEEVWHVRRNGTEFPTLMSNWILKDPEGKPLLLCATAIDITEQKNTEQSLQESEERLRVALSAAQMGTWRLDPSSNQDTRDASLNAILGLEAVESTQPVDDFLQCVHPEDRDMVDAEIQRAVREHRTYVAEFRIVRPDGSVRWLRDQGKPIHGENDHLFYLTGAVVDITERKRAEDALWESEKRFRDIFENIAVGVYRTAPDGQILMANPALVHMLGYSSFEELNQRNLEEEGFEPQYKRSTFREEIEREGRIVSLESTWITRNGKELHVIENARAVRDKDGKTLYYEGTAENITERKKAEDALRESEERYRTLVESAGESIAMFDNKGRFLFINERGAKQLGGKPGDFTGKTMWDLFPKKIADRQAEAVKKAIRTEKEIKEIALTELRGRSRWYNSTIVPLRNSHGRVTAALVMARDIHEQKQAEEALNEYREKITNAERLITLGTLSAIMAHKLSSHLMAIRVSIENSLAELSTMSPPNTIIEDLNNSLSSLYNIVSEVDKIRDLANKPSEEITSEVNLKAVAKRIVNLLKENAQRARVVLHLKDMDKLPTIYSNEQDIEQLFIALVENALQAADRKRSHRLVISGDVKDKQIELRFADTCGGIAKKNLDKIFEPFFTTRPPGEGTGLGLYIVENIVSKAGGKVRVESKAGKGSTFFITLPINK